MRVLLLTGQSDRPELALFLGLQAQGHQLFVLGTQDEASQDLFRTHGIKYAHFKPKSRYDLGIRSYLKSCIKDFNPDIVHAFTGRTLAAAVGVKNKASPWKLLTYRGTVGHLSRFDPASVHSFLSSKVDHISCVSDAVRRYLIKQKVPETKLSVIYKGHDPLWYEPKRRLTRESLGLGVDDFVVCCIANARPVKGVDVFIEAANVLRAERRFRFLVIGNIKDAALIAKNRNEGLRFLGYRADASEVLSISNCLVVPSRGREGLPKALLEAIAQKKITISSAVGGIPEVIRQEEDGILLPPNDRTLLASAIRYVAKHPERTQAMEQSAFDRLIQSFPVGAMVKGTEQMYAKYQ